MFKISQYAIILFILFQMTPLYCEYTISSATISNGGILNSQSGDKSLSSTIGEPIIGNLYNADNQQLFAGFWNTYLLSGTSDIEENAVLPYKYELSQNYPNPFNPTTTINYQLQKDNLVSISIYNIKGELVKNLINNKIMKSGNHSVEFDGQRLSSGYYFYKFSVGINGKDFSMIKKMIMVK